jgi:N-acetylglucosamine-6-sulfatase
MTDLLNSHVIAFLKRTRSKPFCLSLAHKAVHGPFTPAERHKGWYSGQPVPRRPNVNDDLGGKPALRRPEAQTSKPANTSDELVRNQLRCLASIDDGVGSILRVLRDTRQLDNTVVIFTSDNGYFWGEHALGDKRAAYEESIRIPLTIRHPALYRAGTKRTDFALNVDLAPTVLELAGVKNAPAMHGRSLVGRSERKSFLAEYFAEPNFPRIPTWQALRNDRWKFIHYTGLGGMDELYDLASDPYEMKNLIVEPAAQRTLRQMQLELQAALRAS